MYESGPESIHFVRYDGLNSEICSAATSGTSTRQYEDEDMEDVVTYNPRDLVLDCLVD